MRILQKIDTKLPFCIKPIAITANTGSWLQQWSRSTIKYYPTARDTQWYFLFQFVISFISSISIECSPLRMDYKSNILRIILSKVSPMFLFSLPIIFVILVLSTALNWKIIAIDFCSKLFCLSGVMIKVCGNFNASMFEVIGTTIAIFVFVSEIKTAGLLPCCSWPVPWDKSIMQTSPFFICLFQNLSSLDCLRCPILLILFANQFCFLGFLNNTKKHLS